MREFGLVVVREFRERVRTKGFILSTIFLPLFVVAIFAVPFLVDRFTAAEDRTVVVLDETAGDFGSSVASFLDASAEPRILASVVRGSLDEHRDRLVSRVMDREIDGFLWLPADFADRGAAEYRGRNVTDFAFIGRLNFSASRALQSARLEQVGLDVTEVNQLLAPASIRTARLTAGGAEAVGGMAAMMWGFVIVFALFMLLMIYGTQVMQSVQEEKTNRISEILISSLRASELLGGKIAGVALVAVLQFSIWSIAAVMLFQLGPDLVAAAGLPADALEGMRLPAGQAAAIAVFALFGFFLYAALFAVIGAAASDINDAQQLVWVAMVPLMIPFFLQAPVTANPDGALAVVLSWLPFTASLGMPMRMAATDVAAAELAGAILLLVFTVAAVAWISGKIYRIGILTTGKRPSMGELWHWVRAA